ncbi:MAG: FecR domain-containing protein [Chloroflexota bacterium]
MTDIAAVLDECVAGIKNGATPDECLAKYADVRQQVEPLLWLAQSVAAMRKVSPSAEFVRASRERLMARLQQESAHSVVKAGRRLAPGKPAPAWQGLWQSLAGARRLALPAALALLLVFGAGLGALRLLSPPAALASQCTLSILSGSAEVQKSGSDSPKPGADGMTLSAGDRVKTPPGSYALLTFFEGSTLRLEPETDVEIQQIDSGDGQAPNIILKQWIGRTWSRVVKMADPGSHYEINTPSATAIVRGTLFATEVDATGSTRVATTEGLVSVVAQGEEVQLPPSRQTQVAAGTVPEPPATVPPNKSELIIIVSTPAIASVSDPTGSSTGNLPSGMSFNQIPGSQSSLSDGTQRITIPQPISGEYLVSLRYLASDAAGFTIKGMSDGKASFQYGGNFSDSGENGWLIRVNLQVDDGSIVDSTLTGAAPLGNQAPEKIVTKAEKDEKPDKPATASDNDRATGGGSSGNNDTTANEGGKNASEADAGNRHSPVADSGIEPGNSQGNSGDANTPNQDVRDKGSSNDDGNADNAGSPITSSTSDQGNSSDKGNVSDNDKGNSGNSDKGNSGNSDKGNSGNSDKSNSGNSDKSNASSSDKGNSGNSDKSNSGNSDKSNASSSDKSNSGNSDKSNSGNSDKSNVRDNEREQQGWGLQDLRDRIGRLLPR